MGDDLKALPPIDLQVYARLATSFRAMRQAIQDRVQLRENQVTTALGNWEGEAANRFPARVEQGRTDAVELMQALEQASLILDGPERSMIVFARQEDERRAAARDWLTRRDEHERNEGWFDRNVGDFLTGEDWEEEIGPMPGGPAPEPHETAPGGPQTDRSLRG